MVEFQDQVEAFKINQKRIDMRVALMCASIYNTNRTKKDKLIKPEMFMPEEKETKEATQAADMLAVAEVWTQLKGGIDKRKGGEIE